MACRPGWITGSHDRRNEGSSFQAAREFVRCSETFKCLLRQMSKVKKTEVKVSGRGQKRQEYSEKRIGQNEMRSQHFGFSRSNVKCQRSKVKPCTDRKRGRSLFCRISYNYASGLADSISRLSSITDSGTTLESYSYLGLGKIGRASCRERV